MTMNRRKISIILTLPLLLFFTGFFLACDLPGTVGSDNTGYKSRIEAEIVFYPDSEVIYYETHGLFCSTIVIPSLETGINSYSLVFYFDPAIIQYQSMYDQYALCNVSESPGSVTIDAFDTEINPGEYVNLCTVTWKAVLTGIMDISAEITAIGEIESSLPVQMSGSTAGTVKIVQEAGSLHFEGSGYIQKGTGFFNTIYFDSEDKIIKEYDLDVFYDPAKVAIDAGTGDNGVIAGADGFFSTVTPGDGSINIKGQSETGMGPGADLEFLALNWFTVDSGRTNIYVVINKMVTKDNVYIKPRTRSIAISIYTENNKPIVDIWFEPGMITTGKDEPFMTSINLNTVGYVLAAYGIDIIYDPAILEIDKTQAEGAGIEAGEDGFLTVSNTLTPGIIQTAGFDLNGRPPDPGLELLRVYWKGIDAAASSEIQLEVKTLADVRTYPISRIRISSCTVTVTD